MSADTGQEITVFECSNCGGNLEFKPGMRALVCPFCGTSNDVPASETPETYEELDYQSALANLEASSQTVEVRVIPCGGCGAEVTMEADKTTAECVYCGTQVVSTGDARRVLQPQYILPFVIERGDATARFRKWISTRRFAPTALKKYVRIADPLKGIYYPFWTFDSNTQSEYSGMRGIYYTEQVRTTNSEGKTVTRTVTKTRWYPAHGTVQRSFDDVLVPASRSLEDDLVRKVQDVELNRLVAYDSRYLSGFHGEAYTIELRDGFGNAKTIMDQQIRADVRRAIGGDTQRIKSVRTVHSDVTFKHVVLPMYALKYKFKDRYFPVVINGATGEVAGKRPVSWIKIASTVVIVGAILTAGFFLLRAFGVI